MTKQVYCWQDERGAWHIGRFAWRFSRTEALVREYHTGELTLVDTLDLKPYPLAPIPEPTK